ncbi:squalene/phytoene synthase family protein [Streptomyces sp. NPDC050625]|uniref:squalene/phytoene synthase family protein n=1 Tax=Streptomyces sp. NPDC050625 TaxID=3154629 RepID=UPI003422EFDE
MSAWNESLDAAGIRDRQLRRDYDAQRELVARARRTAYLAARLLLPRPLLPHVVAATAVMDHGDDLLDSGPEAQRFAAWAAWEQQVRKGLDSGVSDDPLVRTLVHSAAARPRLREAVESYLCAATAELEFGGFASEADYQAYLDAYSLPAFMLVGVLLGPDTDTAPYRAACRTLIDGSQRLDFVNDLAEDLREGRIGISAQALEHHAVTLEDLAAGRVPAGLAELVNNQVAAARASLAAARELPALTTAPGRLLLTALVDMELLTAKAVLARGPRLLQGSASPSPVAALRVLMSARRRK